MNSSASDHQRQHILKRWIVVLLAVSTLAALTLNFSYSPSELKQLHRADQIDSLIQTQFDQFGIHSEQVRLQTVRIDSLGSRKIYTVDVPPGFSKTRWHYELDREVKPYRLQTPANVIFPERNLRIHLYNGLNVVRTIHLRENDELLLYSDEM